MKFKFRLLIIIIMVSVSCKSQQIAYPQICKTELKKDIQINWKYDSVEAHYKTDIYFLKRIDSLYYPCFVGQDTSTICRLFGSKYSMSKQVIKDAYYETMEYKLSKPCAGNRLEFHCEFIYFYYDKNHKVLKTEVLMWGGY